MKKLLGILVLSLLWCSVVFSHEAPKTTEAKQNYIQNYLQLFEIEAEIINTLWDEKKPGIKYAIKNISNTIIQP